MKRNRFILVIAHNTSAYDKHLKLRESAKKRILSFLLKTVTLYVLLETVKKSSFFQLENFERVSNKD